MKKKYLITIILFIAVNALINKNFANEDNPRIIPIIKYEPYNFLESVRKSFSCTDNDYVKISKEDTNCFIFSFMSSTYIPGEERKICNPHYPMYYNDVLFSNDSIFALYLEYIPGSFFNGKLPVKYWGKLGSGTMHFFIIRLVIMIHYIHCLN